MGDAEERREDGEDMRIEFSCTGIPQPKGSKKAFAYIDKNTGKPKASVVDDNKKTLSVWKKDFTLQSNRHKPEKPLEGPIKVRLIFYMPRPKSAPKEKRPLPITRQADTDKLTRTMLDLFSGGFYKDDSQVVDIMAYKRYADDREPGVEVRLEEISI